MTWRMLKRAGVEPAKSKWGAGAYGAATLTTDPEDAKIPVAEVTIAAGASVAETNALAERLLTLLNKCV